MTTLSRKWSGADPPRAGPEPCNCAWCGAVVGLVIALVGFFVGNIYFAGLAGLCNGSCVALGTFMTIVLSQPVALVGVLIGAALGGGYGFAACHWRNRQQEE